MKNEDDCKYIWILPIMFIALIVSYVVFDDVVTFYSKRHFINFCSENKIHIDKCLVGYEKYKK